MMRWLTYAGIALSFFHCTSPSGTTNKFADLQLQKIYDLKDRRTTDSLLLFLSSDNPVYRQEAALAFASVQDSLASLALGRTLLEDSDPVVRRNAAFALGQTGGQAIKSLISATRDKDRSVASESLVALGKTVSDKDRSALTSFVSEDSVVLEGLGWGLYQLALRKKSDSVATRRATELLKPTQSFQTRLAAANYFGRSAKIEGKGFEDALLLTALSDPRPEVRMAAAAGLRHVHLLKLLPALEKLMHSERDYRVRVNGLRACQNSPDSTIRIVFDALKDSSVMVQIAASELIRNVVSASHGYKRISEDLTEAKFPRVRANLYGALLKSTPPDLTIEEMVKEYEKADDYYKSQLLSALGESYTPVGSAQAVEFVSSELLKQSVSSVVATSAAAALTELDNHEKNPKAKSVILEVYKKAILNGDPAVTGIICGALMDPTLGYKEVINDVNFLKEARGKLSLPRDIESIQPIDEAIAFLEGKPKPSRPTNEFNHPIDWKLVREIPASQVADIKTTRGTVTIQLLIEESPGSASNFIALASKGYFNGKFVHRVVPNFVAQAGCNRGDGFGSEDYSIRSEFTIRRYETGSVGMASAGKDTEGTQWFITHCPTPHLDGRYSIFAVVVNGMALLTSFRLETRFWMYN